MRVAQPLNSKSAARLELFARHHRSCLTESEARLWSALKARQLGVSFRRQVPVAELFIADFLAPSIKLIVEVDGAIRAKAGPRRAPRSQVAVRGLSRRPRERVARAQRSPRSRRACARCALAASR